VCACTTGDAPRAEHSYASSCQPPDDAQGAAALQTVGCLAPCRRAALSPLLLHLPQAVACRTWA
jgi:hypothetical protein